MAFYLQDQYPSGSIGGACFFCKSCQREQESVISTDVELELDYEGSLAICEQCATELGRMVGLRSETEYQAIKVRNAALSDDCDSLRDEVDEASVKLDSVLQALQLVKANAE